MNAGGKRCALRWDEVLNLTSLRSVYLRYASILNPSIPQSLNPSIPLPPPIPVYPFPCPPYHRGMIPVEKIKYTIWAADSARATEFYTGLFGAVVLKQNPHITELEIAGGIISIHSGGEGVRTWTGITLQVPDVVVGAAAVRQHGGECPRDPQPEDGEPPHLAMCVDTEGNEFMLTRDRSR
jgi:lactoylglutathione lyase